MEKMAKLKARWMIWMVTCCCVFMAGIALADRETYTDSVGLVYDGSGYFSGKTIVGYEGNAKTVTIPADVDEVCFQDGYDYSSIETISLKQIQGSTEVDFYGSFPALKKFIGPDSADSPYYVEDGVLLCRRYYVQEYGFYHDASVIKCPVNYSGTYTVPEGITYLNWNCFRDCKSLTAVILHNGITPGSRVFKNCTALKSVVLPEDIDSIADEMFYNCQSLASLDLPASVEDIGKNAFYGVPCKINVVKGSYAHKYMFQANGLYAYTVDGKAPDSSSGGTVNGFTYFVKSNGKATILECQNSGDVVIPSTISGITVDNLEKQLFYGRSGITSVSIPKTVTYFGTSETDNNWDYVFSYCYDLKSINVNKENPVFSSMDGVLFSKDGKTLINYPVSHAGTTYYTPEETRTVCCTAFASASNLKKLYLTNPNTWWYTYTFYNTPNLTVYYPEGGQAETCVNNAIKNGLTHDQDSSRNVFRTFDPADLSKLSLPKKLKIIEEQAFAGATARKIVVPSGVSDIRSKAFANCPNLEYLELPAGQINIADDILYGCSGVTVICPAGSAAETWAEKNGLTVKNK